MGRFKAEMVGVICLALLGSGIPLTAQESAQQPKPAAHPSGHESKSVFWKKVDDGIWERYVSRYAAPGTTPYPEFAVVRLSDDRYTEFKNLLSQSHGEQFLNNHKIFKVPVNQVISCTEAKSVNPKPTTGAHWYVIVPHWPNSTAACAAYPEWSPPAP